MILECKQVLTRLLLIRGNARLVVQDDNTVRIAAPPDAACWSTMDDLQANSSQRLARAREINRGSQARYRRRLKVRYQHSLFTFTFTCSCPQMLLIVPFNLSSPSAQLRHLQLQLGVDRLEKWHVWARSAGYH